MADIRINSLPTTASTSSSDDFLALDGATNGTRKLNAYSPTFGGSATVGDLTLGTSGPSVKSTLSARAPRQGLVFDGTAGASANVGTIGSSPVSFGGRCTIPASGTNVLFAISASATTPAQPKALAIYTFGTSLYVQLNATIGNYLLGEVSGFVTTYAGKVVDILAVRSTSGNIALYVNGVATSPSFSSVGGSAPANWQADIDGPYALLGITSVSAWVAGTFYPPVCYNRALSASEVVALYEAGAPAGADYNSASNTSLITGDNSTFASDTGYWTKSSATISGGNLNLSSDGSSIFRANLLVIGKKYRYVTSISANTTSVLIGSGSGAGYGTVTTTGTITGEFTATSTTFVIYQSGAGAATVGDITLFSLGLLLAPDAAQAGGGLTWYDTSGNAANITLPASGVSWNVPSSRVLGGNWTTSGNLTVSGTGTSSFGGVVQVSNTLAAKETNASLTLQPGPGTGGINYAFGQGTGDHVWYGGTTERMRLTYLGNLLIGTTTDSANGKLQLATHTTSAGGIGFGTDTALYRYGAGRLGLTHIGGNTPILYLLEGTTETARLWTANGPCYLDTLTAQPIYFRPNGTTALTLDSSQRCILSGALRLANTYVATPQVSTGYVTIQDSTGTTYKVLVAT